MAFSGVTPESLLPRSDSRNPATTCKGITKTGRPCRRPIDANPSEENGVLAIVSVASHSDSDSDSDSDGQDVGAAAYFCWQHKDQAERLAAQASNGPPTQLYALNERSSIDTLVERLGVLQVDDDAEEPWRRKRRTSRPATNTSGMRPQQRIHRPATWDRIQGPLMSVPSDLMAGNRRQHRPANKPPRKKLGFWSSLCCSTVDDDDDDDDEEIEIIRHKRRTGHAAVTQEKSPIPVRPSSARRPKPQQDHARRPSACSSRPPTAIRRTSNPAAGPPRNEKTPGSPPKTKPGLPPDSATATLLRYIPPTLPPHLASTLLAELIKPISPHDDEGYIYIFWLTPDCAGPAPATTASTLLSPPTRPEQGRRASDVLRQFSVKKSDPPARPGTRGRRPSGSACDASAAATAPATAPAATGQDGNTILLKIGRANNVHRRMNEWTRQCGYSLSLVRYYPYVPSTPSPQTSPAQSRRHSSAGGVRKVPHAMRVERLIHLELSEQRVVKKCEACGKEHREWFEVEASKEGVRRVDEVVKRWVDWAERTTG